jgi:hypothetical protein
MGEVVRLAARETGARLELENIVVFLTCHQGEVKVRMPAVEDTPENRVLIGRMFVKAAEALTRPTLR